MSALRINFREGEERLCSPVGNEVESAEVRKLLVVNASLEVDWSPLPGPHEPSNITAAERRKIRERINRRFYFY